MEIKILENSSKVKDVILPYAGIIAILKDHYLNGINSCIVGTSEQLSQIKNLHLPILFTKDVVYNMAATNANSNIVKESDRQKTAKRLASFHNYLSAFSSKSIGNQSLRAWLRSKSYTLPYPLSFTITNQFAYTSDEFEIIRQAIKNGSELYNEEFDSIAKNGLKNLKFKDESDISELLSEYQSDIDRLEDLHLRYSRAFSSEKLSSYGQAKSSCQIIHKLKEEIEVKLHEHQLKFGEEIINKPGLLSLNKASKEAFESYKALIDAVIEKSKEVRIHELDRPVVIDIKSIVDIKLLVDNLNYLLENWWVDQEKHLDSKLKRINHINLQNTSFKELYTELVELLRSMQSKAIYVRDLECNARSSIKQLEFLDELIISLKNEMSDLMRIPKYFKWKNFLEQQNPLTSLLFKHLSVLPKDKWESCFVANYIHFYCEQILITSPVFTQENLEELKREVIKSMSIFESHNRWLYDNALKDTIQKAADIDKQISKKLTSGIEALEILNQSDQLYFPIYACTLDENAFIERCKKNKIEIIDLDKISNIQASYIEIPDAKIADTPVTEQITIAKELARGILAITRNIKIYQMQFANVICVDDTVLPSILIQEMKKFGVKEFSLGEYGEERLIESIIMTDRPQFCIVRDGILDTDNTKNIAQQLIAIQAIENAGYSIINIWTSEVKEDVYKIKNILNNHILPEERK